MSDYQLYVSKQPNVALAKKLKWVIWALCAVVFALVGMMRSKTKLDLGIDFSFLPPVHAALNSAVAICLVVAFIAVKRKNISLHKLGINVAMVLSILFLLCYVAYHFTTQETLFGDINKDYVVSPEEKLQLGNSRAVYLVILLSHIALAGISLPLILFTWLYGVTNQFSKHRKFAKITFPMWLYVAVTGPICYFMLMPYY